MRDRVLFVRVVFACLLFAAVANATPFTPEPKATPDVVTQDEGASTGSFSWLVVAPAAGTAALNIWADSEIAAVPFAMMGLIRGYELQHCDETDTTTEFRARLGPGDWTRPIAWALDTPALTTNLAQGLRVNSFGESVYFKHRRVNGDAAEADDAEWHVPHWIVSNSATAVDVCVTAFFQEP